MKIEINRLSLNGTSTQIKVDLTALLLIFMSSPVTEKVVKLLITTLTSSYFK